MNKKRIFIITIAVVMILTVIMGNINNVKAATTNGTGKPELVKLSIEGNKKITANDKLNLNIETKGEVNFITVTIKNKDVPSQKILISVKDGIIDFSKKGSQKLYDGENYIDEIFFNSNGQGEYVCYSTDGRNNTIKMNFDTTFTVVSGEKPVLNSVSIEGSKTLTRNDTLQLKLDTTGEVQLATVLIKNKNVESQRLLVSASKDNGKIDLSKLGNQKIYNGENYIDAVFLNPSIEGVYTWYSLDGREDSIKMDFNASFTLVDENQNNPTPVDDNGIVLNSVSLDKTTAKLNDKIRVDLKTNSNIISATLIFKGTTANGEESMMVNLKDLTGKGESYFVVPFTAKAGDYELNYVILKDEKGNEVQYRKGEEYYSIKHFDFNSTLKVEDELASGNLLSLDNDKITDEIIEKIHAMDSNIVFEVNANNNPVIDSKLFAAIQNTDKTVMIRYNDVEWSFNGLNIKEPKQINIATTICNSVVDKDVSNILNLKFGLVIYFPENGQLPGKCLMKIYNTGEISKIMNSRNANIYYWNKETGKCEVIDLNKQLQNDGYYEFYIDHNSTYIMSPEKVNEEYIQKDTATTPIQNDEKVLTEEERGIVIAQQTAIIIAVVVGCIVILAIVCIISSVRANKKLAKVEKNDKK